MKRRTRMIDLLITLIPLALIDCLNPATISTQAFLLIGTENPQRRAIAHALGVYVAYFLIGFLIVFGLGELLKQLFAYTLGTAEYALMLIVGSILIFLAYRMNSKDQTKIGKYVDKIRNLSPLKTFFFGFFSTFMDIPTAFPYFAAIALLIGVQLPFLGLTALLLFYDFLYVLPLLILVGVYLVTRGKCASLLQRINDKITMWSVKIAKAFLILIGALLIVASIAFFLGFPIL
jgi:cytochrome c biogenesis protein CcdA